MFRHLTAVRPDDTVPLRAELDGTDPTAPGWGHHLGFDKILRRCGLAWLAFLDDLGGFGTGVIVPRLEVDYAREVDVGDLEVAVTVLAIGRTSFRLRCVVSQDGRVAASVQVVLVCFDYDRSAPVPLDAQQQAALTSHLE
jgi:acyl-CoA thioesterase FadM